MKRLLIGLILLVSSVAGYAAQGYRVLGPVTAAENWILSRHQTQDGICAVSTIYNVKSNSVLHSNTLAFMIIDRRWHIVLGKTDFSGFETPLHQYTTRSITTALKTWVLKLKVMESGLWAPVKPAFVADLFLSSEMVIRTTDKLVGHYSLKGLPEALKALAVCSMSREAEFKLPSAP